MDLLFNTGIRCVGHTIDNRSETISNLGVGSRVEYIRGL